MKKKTAFFLVSMIFLLTAVLTSGCGQDSQKQEPKKTENTAEVDREIDPRPTKTDRQEPKAGSGSGVQAQTGQQDQQALQGQQTQKDQEDTQALQQDQQGQESLQTQAGLADLQAQLDARLAERRAAGESWAVYVERLSDGASLSSGNQPLESASLIKLFTAATAEKIHGELESLESYPGETDALLQTMITVSDNDAANTLVGRIGGGDTAAGMQRINDFCQEQGFTETHMGRLMLDFSAPDDNYTSPRDCASLLKRFYNRQLDGSDQILEFMKAQERTGKIPAGLPAGTVCANKTGELDDVENDAAVVFAGTGDYTVCIMSNHLTDTAGAQSLFAELSGIIYQYMSQNLGQGNNQ